MKFDDDGAKRNKAHKLLADIQALDRFREMNARRSASEWTRQREQDLYVHLDAELGADAWKGVLALQLIGGDDESQLLLIMDYLNGTFPP